MNKMGRSYSCKNLKKLMLQSNLDKMTVLPNIIHVIWVILRDFSFFRSTSGLLLVNFECLIWSRVEILGLICGLVGPWSTNRSTNFIFLGLDVVRGKDSRIARSDWSKLVRDFQSCWPRSGPKFSFLFISDPVRKFDFLVLGTFRTDRFCAVNPWSDIWKFLLAQSGLLFPIFGPVLVQI